MGNPKGGRYTPPLRKRVMGDRPAVESYVELELVPGTGNARDLAEARTALAAMQAAEGPPPLRRRLTAKERRLYREFYRWVAARKEGA
jgi:hypothetical protein